MKFYQLDPEEAELLKSLEAGEWKSVENLEERKKELQQMARMQMQKTRNINIRVTEADFIRIKEKAMQEGLPYQTMLGSIIHKAL